ncbi:MAG: WYL domain-containing protein [Actinobacteria bacterium]|nr:WYL domain-containing protein [Actinomycetota bacterium]MSY87467.1 WYL domain-containing protein [Actinomycetota bacterium]
MARESSLARYGRLINLIPMLYSNPSMEIAEVARDLEITEKQLLDDLNLLWMCGLPGHSHLELIDMNFESGFIEIIEPQNLARPLNLTPLEVTEILLGLELISAEVDPSTLVLLDSVRTKLTDSLPSIPRVGGAIRVERERASASVADMRTLVLQAIADEREIVAVYRSLSGSDSLERRLTPLQIVTRDGHDYVAAVEHGDHVRKVFRLDRFDQAHLGERSETITPMLTLTEPASQTLRIEVPQDRAFLADRVNAVQVGTSKDRVILEFKYFEAHFAARVALAFGAGTRLIGSGAQISRVAELLERLLGQVRDAYRERE